MSIGENIVPKIERVSVGEFFRDYDGAVARCLDRFPELLAEADADPANQAAADALAGLGAEFVSIVFRVCRLPADDHGGSAAPTLLIERLQLLCNRFGGSAQAPYATVAEELRKHVDYCVAQIERLNGGGLLGVLNRLPAFGKEDAGQTRSLANRYRRDLIVHTFVLLTSYVFSGFKWVAEDPRSATRFLDADAIRRDLPVATAVVIEASKIALEGWCSEQKAMMLYDLAREHRPKVTVEIGIYGGRSIVPLALAMRDNGQGHVTGIETWSAINAKQYRTDIANDFWWMTVDFRKLKRDFHAFLAAHDLDGLVRVVEAPSDRAHYLFDQIDMLHIDGGHSTFGAAQDVVNYVSKVRRGGVIIYDDIDWPSTGAGLQILMDTCRLLHVVETMNGPGQPGCAAFLKI